MEKARFRDGSRDTRAAGLRRLWVFDFDGTLSPLVPERSAARIHPECRKMLEELSGRPGERAAVLSSRTVEDLVPRVPVPGVLLGGGSGLEWRLPGGGKVGPGREAESRARKRREELSPLFETLGTVPGVDIEDKRWSVAVHTRRVPPEARAGLASLLGRLHGRPGLRVFAGPESVEVPLLGRAGKSSGIRTLCRLLEFDPPEGGLVYAGDDGNDAAAMRWVLARKGIALVVGNLVLVPGATVLEDPPRLAEAVRGMAGLPPRGAAKGRREAAAG